MQLYRQIFKTLSQTDSQENILCICNRNVHDRHIGTHIPSSQVSHVPSLC